MENTDNIGVTIPPFKKINRLIRSGVNTDWSHDYYDIKGIHNLGKRGAGIKVAVLDTGVDLEHSSFQKAISESRLKSVDGRIGKNDPVDRVSGHGCVTPNTLLHTTLCGMNTIEEFFDRVKNFKEKIVVNDELIKGSISLEPKKDIFTTSWDGKSFTKSRITHVHKFPYEGNLIVIKTREGELKLTPWHPLYILKRSNNKGEMKVVKKRADEVIKDDKILCASSTDINSNNYRNVNGFILDENMAYYAGLILSDGHIVYNNIGKYEIRFSNNEDSLIDEFERLSKLIFNKDVGKGHIKDNQKESVIYSKEAVETLIELGVPSENKSKTVTLPELITKSPKSVILSFLAGVIDGDGSVNKKDGRVRIVSASEEFCIGVVNLMRIIGYRASYSVNSRKGFMDSNKESITYAIRIPRLDYPLVGYKKDYKKITKPVRKSSGIVSISSEEYVGYLYDLTVKDNHNYVSTNGYIVSNTWCVSRYISDDSTVLGFAPDCELLSIKVLDDDGTGSISDIINGLKIAVDNHVDIISTSIGWASKVYSSELDKVVKDIEDKSIVWVSAAGNDGKHEDIDYPAFYDYVISVGSHDSDGRRSRFSDFGIDLDLYSSGNNVLGAYLNDKEAYLAGTSMATPSLGALIAILYDDLIGKYGKINRESLKKVATCL